MLRPSPIPPTDLIEAIRAAVTEALAKRPQVQWRGVRGQAERLDISERLLRRWISRSINPAPAVKVDGKLLLNDADVDRWLRDHKLGRDIDRIAEKALVELSKS